MTRTPDLFRNQILVAPVAGLLLLAGCATPSGPNGNTAQVQAPVDDRPAQRLQAPAGFHAPAASKARFEGCPEMSTPHTGPLDFPSKYQGSDSARDDLNEQFRILMVTELPRAQRWAQES